MTNTYDFERAWLTKFSNCLDKTVGTEIRETVMQGSETLSSNSDRGEVIAWSKQAMERLDMLVDEDQRKIIMTGCACHYPKSKLQEMRQVYSETKDLDRVHQMLQEQFESFLEKTKQLDEDVIAEIMQRGWGAAGVKQGATVIATKIPKSSFLVEYMQETEPEKKMQYYCHCPRIRDV